MNATEQTKSERQGPARDQGRLLLVTDDSQLAATYGPALEQAGFVVAGVSGGAAAIVSLRRTRPHVVIADIGLKGIRALELARLVSQMQDGLPLVLVGLAPATLERRAEALAAGAFDYFQVPHELTLCLSRISQLVAVRQTVERLQSEADRDYLTGLANRRRFRTALGQEVERWRRYHVPCALILVDIDFMKRINDQYGHSAGDVVIRHVASALTDLSRDNDTAARLGGEEFALLLAGVDDVKAAAAAERLRQAVAEEVVEMVGTVTVSLGVAACPAHAQTERTLYAACDAALYQAKREGRNRSVLAPAAQLTVSRVKA